MARLLHQACRKEDVAGRRDGGEGEQGDAGEREWQRLQALAYGQRIAEAELIANPGCYPTASMLALAPLAEAGLCADVVIDATSGVSGAARGGAAWGDPTGEPCPSGVRARARRCCDHAQGRANNEKTNFPNCHESTRLQCSTA